MQRLLATVLFWLVATAGAYAAPWPNSCLQSIAIGQTTSGGQLTTGDCFWTYDSSPNDRYYTDVYEFIGNPGQQISITLTSSDFDPWLELYNVNDLSASPLADDDNGGGGTSARIPAGSGTFTLPAGGPTAGKYYILVGSFGPSATGAYTLALSGTNSDSARVQVQKAYVSYYGRAADPAGLDYWVTRLDAEGGSLAAIIAAFGFSDEFSRRYGGLSHTDLVTRIYRQTLSRDPDQAGLAYYVNDLDAKRRLPQSITLDVLNGAVTAPDSTTVANKLEVADYFTADVKGGCAYGVEQTGVDALTPVTHLPATVSTAKAAIDARCP